MKANYNKTDYHIASINFVRGYLILCDKEFRNQFKANLRDVKLIPSFENGCEKKLIKK